ncbi:hypothetical protein RND71_004436 [Anisodus tanguticus]|uniref:Uncharacterized protein n=1 Tax=Anisodus tanguticus TaxID=243964 RepID=A0AAE1SPZ1_9SOLA|nr:hypothetical protein RND71_004436 [Anisodus tanguticus]
MVAGGSKAAGGEKSKSQHPTRLPPSSTSHTTNSEWQTVNHRWKTTGKSNPNPPQNTPQPTISLETLPPATGTVNTTSLVVENTIQASDPTSLPKNTILEIFSAGNPTGIFGDAGNPIGTLGSSGDSNSTHPQPRHPPTQNPGSYECVDEGVDNTIDQETVRTFMKVVDDVGQPHISTKN